MFDFVEEERGSFPGGIAGEEPLISPALRVDGSTIERGLKCRSMSWKLKHDNSQDSAHIVTLKTPLYQPFPNVDPNVLPPY